MILVDSKSSIDRYRSHWFLCLFYIIIDSPIIHVVIGFLKVYYVSRTVSETKSFYIEPLLKEHCWIISIDENYASCIFFSYWIRCFSYHRLVSESWNNLISRWLYRFWHFVLLKQCLFFLLGAEYYRWFCLH